MTLVIPGVEVRVVKEVVAPQLSPTGILGVVGVTEHDPGGPTPVQSWSRFVELFGPASAVSMPEAMQALSNGVAELVVSPIATTNATKAFVEIPGIATAFKLTARDSGAAANDLVVTIADRSNAARKLFDLTVKRGDETIEHLSGVPLENAEKTIADTSKTLLLSSPAGILPREGGYPLQGGVDKNPEDSTDTGKQAAVEVPGVASAFKLASRVAGTRANGLIVALANRTGADGKKVFDLTVSQNGTTLETLRAVPIDTAATEIGNRSSFLLLSDATGSIPQNGDKYDLADGADPGRTEYAAALRALEDEPDVDMVLAAVQDAPLDTVKQIYGDVISHCVRMSTASKGRIGIADVPAGATVRDATEMASALLSERFVLLAPHGVAGAVAGMIGSLDYFESPTFKPIAGLTQLSANLKVEDQETLLKGFVVPVVAERGRGTIVLRGLTTDGDQISVRRIADRAVRGVKMIGDLFIGRLNNELGRNALKQKLMEFLVQMERDGAIVPSTDGKDPAFKVNVYSSQSDFSQGVVRVDMAVRPVRAIDYIYATVVVQA